jgi:hypothetical protein
MKMQDLSVARAIAAQHHEAVNKIRQQLQAELEDEATLGDAVTAALRAARRYAGVIPAANIPILPHHVETVREVLGRWGFSLLPDEREVNCWIIGEL